jgi:hypothetical protein
MVSPSIYTEIKKRVFGRVFVVVSVFPSYFGVIGVDMKGLSVSNVKFPEAFFLLVV